MTGKLPRKVKEQINLELRAARMPDGDVYLMPFVGGEMIELVQNIDVKISKDGAFATITAPCKFVSDDPDDPKEPDDPDGPDWVKNLYLADPAADDNAGAS
ncbi:MAG: hypothetical protein AAGB02_04485 [Pseudomonadota bacterium]